jgi:hypothetical protein
MTNFEKTINNLRSHLETVSDILGPECIEHLRDHYEWHIQYYEKNGETEHAEEYRRKIEDLSLAIAYMQDGLRQFIDAGMIPEEV